MKTLTKRKIFNKVKDHLLKQMKVCRGIIPSGKGSLCKYREGTLRCSIGALIPNKHYTPDIEGTSIQEALYVVRGDTFNNHSLLLRQVLSKSGIPEDIKFYELLLSLQVIHDEYNVQDWEKELKNLEKSGVLV